MASISLEFFPPKTADQQTQFQRSLPKFIAMQPEYVSVTFGAGGSTLSYTPETVKKLMAEGVATAPHLSCMGGTREEIAALLDTYRALGCRRVVALRGDLPSGMARAGDLRYASELVAFIRSHSGEHFRIEVGCYPEVHPQAEDAAFQGQDRRRCQWGHHPVFFQRRWLFPLCQRGSWAWPTGTDCAGHHANQ